MATLQNYADTFSRLGCQNCCRFTGLVCIILFDTTGELKKQCIPGAPSEFVSRRLGTRLACVDQRNYMYVYVSWRWKGIGNKDNLISVILCEWLILKWYTMHEIWTLFSMWHSRHLALFQHCSMTKASSTKCTKLTSWVLQRRNSKYSHLYQSSTCMHVHDTHTFYFCWVT